MPPKVTVSGTAETLLDRQTSACASPPAKSKYRPEIDGLRAFAVVAVIINHFNKDLLPSGYLGVDIFFVISGYVITSSLANRESKNFGDFITGFYERRIKRLVPALVVFVLITSILICLFNPDPKMNLENGAKALFGLSNISLYRRSTDYFAQATELNPFTHTWSLGVEEQFYLIFPFLIWFSGFGRQAKNGARNIFIWVGALTVASLAGFIYLYQTNQPAAYFLMPPRFWEMAAGCLIFIGFQKRAKIEQAIEKLPPLLAIATMVGVMLLPVTAAVPATISIVLLTAILIACLKQETAAYKFFTLRKIVYIGLISYSLYLWHWGVLCISRWTIGIHWWSVPFQILLIFLLASSSYALVEKPCRSFSSQKAESLLVFVTGLSTLALTSIALLAVSKIKILGLNLSEHLYNFANPEYNSSVMGAANNQRLRSLAFAPDWDDKSNGVDTIKFAKCQINRPITDADFKSCLKLSQQKQGLNNRFYIFGDSHAANYAFAIRKAFPGRVAMITVGLNCGYVSAADSKKLNSHMMNCEDYVKNVDKFVANLGDGDVVILGNSWQKDSPKRKSPDQESAIRKLANLTVQRGAKFVLLDDVPPVGDPLLSVRKWYRPFAYGVTKKQADNDLSRLDAIGARLTKDVPGTMYLSLRGGLCSANLCSAKKGNKFIYLDDGHITVEASENLSPTAKEKLARFIKP